MSKLETAQILWEESTKIFDKIENDDKKEWFNNLINELEKNNSIIWLKDKRNSMTEDQKLTLYKRNPTSINEHLKTTIYKCFRSIYNWAINTTKHWWNNAAKFAFLEQIPCRFFVELWILSKPKSLTKEKLIEDAKKDAKNFNIYLWICEAVCACIPDAQVAVPFIGIARHYTKRYRDHWTEVITQRIKYYEEDDIKQQTNKELAEAISNTNIQEKTT